MEQTDKQSNLEQEVIESSINLITKEILYSDDESEEDKEEKNISIINKEHIFDQTSEITLECLMNKSTYLKYLKNQYIGKETKITNNIKNRKFYKKRINDLTKQLMHNEPGPSTEIVKAFDNYIQICINYFQVLDKTDILQQDYVNITESDICKLTNLESIDEANKSMMRFVKMHEPNSLEKIVKRTIIKSPAVPNPNLPKQKNINLKDPILRNKGICKKNNISNKYEDATTTTPPPI